MATKHYRVNLEIFEGPLDLLLFLIKKNDLDILNIEISKITKEYIQYLELMQELNLEVVGEFLVMASTLMQIKAKSLLPSAEMPEEDAGPDPRSELVAKLVEYQKFKEAANFLKDRSEEFQNVFYRGAPQFEERDKALNIRIFDLLGTLREVLDRAEEEGRIIEGEAYPIEDKIDKILKLLAAKPYVSLLDVFEGETRRRAIITCFMALLELIKTQRAFARQDTPYAPIMIYKKDAPVEELSPVWASDEAAAEEAPEAPGEDFSFAAASQPTNGAPPWRRPRKTESLGPVDEAAAAAARAYLEDKAAKDELLASQPKQPEEFELPPDRAPVERASERIAAEAEAKLEAEAVEQAEVEVSFFEPAPADPDPVSGEPEPIWASDEVPKESAAEEPAGEGPKDSAAEEPEESGVETSQEADAEVLEETDAEVLEPAPDEALEEPAPIDTTRKAWSQEPGDAALETEEEDEPEMKFTDEPGFAPGEPLDEEKHDGQDPR